MSVILLGVLLLLCFIVYVVVIKPGLYWQTRGVFYVKPWVRFFKVFLTAKSFAEIVKDSYDEFPNLRYYGSYQFMTPSLFVRDLELVKRIAVKDFDHFTDHLSFVSARSDPVLAANLFSLRGERWKRMRTTLSPAFTSSKMRMMFLLMADTARNFVDRLAEKEEDVVVVEMKDAFAKYANDVIASCAFGIKVDSVADEANQFFRMGKEAGSTSLSRALRSLAAALLPKLCELLKIPAMPAHITSFFRHVIKNAMAEREERGIVRPDMVHLLMQARKGKLSDDSADGEAKPDQAAATEENSSNSPPKNHHLTDDEITAQAFVFFFAGFETVSGVSSFLAYELALQPEIQKKLQADIDEVLAKRRGGNVTYEDLSKMKYMDQVISEGLRKWPPAFALSRLCVKDYLIEAEDGEKPLMLEKGCAVLIPAYGIHMDEKYFPDPDRFDPERFGEARAGMIVPGSYMPFGVGPRNCIGSRFALLEIKTLLFHVLAKFDFVVVDRTPVPLKLVKSIGLAAVGGLWLGLKRR